MKASVSRRVLMLLENKPYPKDGRVRREARALAAAGYQVSVICPLDPGQSGREMLDGVRVYRFAAPPPANGFLGYLWEYGYSMMATFVLSLLVFLREGFDVIHSHNPPDTFVFIAAFYKLFGKRFVYDHHDLTPELYCARFGGSGDRLVYHALVLPEKLSCQLADHVIATNQSYKTVEMERGGVPEERITIVRNGPDVNRLRPVAPDPDLRQKAKTIIGYVGVMGFQDGIDYLLRALQHLVYDLGRTDFFCVLVGTGDAWLSLKSLTEQLGLADYVWFTGWVEHTEVVRYLSAADICAAPEPSGNVPGQLRQSVASYQPQITLSVISMKSGWITISGSHLGSKRVRVVLSHPRTLNLNVSTAYLFTGMMPRGNGNHKHCTRVAFSVFVRTSESR